MTDTLTLARKRLGRYTKPDYTVDNTIFEKNDVFITFCRGSRKFLV